MMVINFFFADISDPDSRITEVDGDGRPIETRIRIPVNRAYYYDPFPALDDEFAMVPRLIRTLHPIELARAVFGNPPEVFEVAYTGIGPSADLFTIVSHEMEHSLGLDANVSSEAPTISCTQASPFFVLDSTYTGGANIAIRAYEKADGTSDCSHLDLGGITECKTDPAQSPLSEEASTVPGLTVYECTSHQALKKKGFVSLSTGTYSPRPPNSPV